MTRLKTEQCIYLRFNEDRFEYIILSVYVDDLVIAGANQEAIMKIKQQRSLRNSNVRTWGSLTGS